LSEFIGFAEFIEFVGFVELIKFIGLIALIKFIGLFALIEFTTLIDQRNPLPATRSVQPNPILLLTRQLNRATNDHHPVISAKAGVQYYRGFCWIPALRFAAVGMT
jgi:hypothetical protein